MLLDGPMHGAAFKAYVEQVLVPELDPGDSVVMANLPAHKVAGILQAHGNSLVFGDGRSEDDIQIYFAGFFYRGQRLRELEREYFENYYPVDERAPRLRHLPDSWLFHITDLYTGDELKTSVAYNEALPRGHAQHSINVRLDGPNGTRIVWVVNDPVDGDGWSSIVAIVLASAAAATFGRDRTPKPKPPLLPRHLPASRHRS